MAETPSQFVGELLIQWQAGEQDLRILTPLVYGELRRIAEYSGDDATLLGEVESLLACADATLLSPAAVLIW